MKSVNPKKQFGQHFLKDKNYATKIADHLIVPEDASVIEIGGGEGILSRILAERYPDKLHIIEYDREAAEFLKKEIPQLQNRIIRGDFLHFDLNTASSGQIIIIGNFPYNISSQIIFKMLDDKEKVAGLTGMFQREVGRRITADPGSKTYGILSVLVQAYYSTEYLFTVNETVFTPPPKVKSGLIRLTRKQCALPCDENLFKTLVKTAFNNRRKILKNSLQSHITDATKQSDIMKYRPEQLSVDAFIQLTQMIDNKS